MVLISALLLFPVFAFTLICNQVNKKILVGIAVIIMSMGIGSFASNMMSEYPDHSKRDAQEYVVANNIIAEYMAENDMDSAEIIFDKLHETFFPLTIEVYSREAMGKSISVTHAITSMKNDYLMTSFDAEEIKEGLLRADFLIINSGEYTDKTQFISDIILSESKELLAEYASKNMHLIGTVSWKDNELEIYAKPTFQIQVQTEWADWLGIDNTDIDLWDIQDRTCLILEGNVLEEQIDVSFENQAVRAYDREGKQLPTEFSLTDSNTRYRIKIDIHTLDSQYDRIHIDFEDFFIPLELLPENKDPRKLTVQFPTRIYMENDM